MDFLELRVNLLINGQGSVVNIMGEAGVGKSRLIAEMKQKEIIRRTKILEGKAVDAGENLNFYPVRRFLKQWTGIREKDNDGLQLEKLEKLLRNICPEQLGELLPFVAKVMGVKLSEKYAGRALGVEGASLEKLIIKNMRLLLRKAASQKPLIIILDDMHWADASSIQLLEVLFSLAKTEKILFINLFRPSFRHPETSGWLMEIARDSYSEIYREIKLEPLAEEDGLKMVDNLLRHSGAPATFKKQIVERSGGNPFFIEEIVRSFIDRGTLVEKGGRFELSEAQNKIVIPRSINEALTSRLDKLDKETSRLLKIAAVIGRGFFHEVLLKVADDMEEIEEKLLYLKNVQLIRKNERKREVEYLFKHGLTREVVYSLIEERDKKELHLKTARAIEEVFKERKHEFYGLTAYHYIQAKELDKAEERMLKAGREAMKASASSEGLRYYKSALEIFLKKSGDAADKKKMIGLQINIMRALFNNGDPEALEYSEKVLKHYGVKLPKQGKISALRLIGNFLSFITKLYVPALGWKKSPTSEGVEKFDTLGKRITFLYSSDFKTAISEVVFSLGGLAKLNISKEHPSLTLMVLNAVWFLNLRGASLSLRLSRKILDWAKPRLLENDKKQLLIYETGLLQNNLFTGNFGQIKKYNQSLVDENLKLGEVRLASLYLGSYATFSLIRGHRYFMDVARRAEITILEYNELFSQNVISMVKGGYLAFYGKAADAEMLKELEAAFVRMRTGEFELFQVYLGYSLIYIKLLRRENDEADALFKEMEEKVAKMPYLPILYSGLVLKVKFYFFLVKLEQCVQNHDEHNFHFYRKLAFKAGSEAVKKAKKTVLYRTETFRLMGKYYWMVDKQRKALEWFDKSRREGERLDARIELSRTYFEIGSRLREEYSRYDNLNSFNSDYYLKKAAAMFEALDMDWDMAKMDKLKLDRDKARMGLSKLEKQDKIIQLNTLLSRHNDYETILKIIIRQTEKIFNVSSGLILKYEEASRLFLYLVDHKSDALKAVQVDEEIEARDLILTSDSPVIENNPDENSSFSGNIDKLTGVKTKHLMAVPLKIHERVTGFLAVVNKKEGIFNDSDLSFFKSIADQISITLQRAKNTEERIRDERMAGMGETVADLSHCIRNIVNGLKSADIIDKYITTDIDDKVQTAWSIMHSNIGRISDLAINMLEYSGERKLILYPSDLNSIVRDIVELIEYNDEYKGTKIELDLDPGLGKIEIDPLSIHRCLLNLTRNALEATEGREERNVTVTTKKRGDKHVAIKVKDNGCGIKESDRKMLFRKFHTTKGSKGTGFGLLIAQKIIDAHEGGIKVASKEGRGTLVTISLPLTRDSR